MSVPPAPPARLMRWPDLLNRPRPNPTRAVFYGGDPNQLAELWLPQGRGLHPVVVLIHGGCWEAATATHTYLNYAAEDLRRRGWRSTTSSTAAWTRPAAVIPAPFRTSPPPSTG